jgi:uncharacterized membrane protein
MEKKCMQDAIFFESITQPKGNIFIFPIGMIVFMTILTIFIVGMMIGVMNAQKNTNISIVNNEVVIRSFMYGTKIPIEQILIHEVRAINLNEQSDFTISIRTNGIGLPNFKSGWMKLRNGKKALAFITNKERVLCMPTKDYIVLFSMEKTDEFISALKRK